MVGSVAVAVGRTLKKKEINSKYQSKFEFTKIKIIYNMNMGEHWKKKTMFNKNLYSGAYTEKIK